MPKYLRVIENICMAVFGTCASLLYVWCLYILVQHNIH